MKNEMKETVAAIFDNDDTLIDTKLVHWPAFVIAARQQGIPSLPRAFRQLQSGRTNEDATEILQSLIGRSIDKARFVDDKKRAVLDLAHRAKIYPDVAPVITELRKRKIPMAIFTSSQRAFIERIQSRFPILAGIPAICREDYKRGKPHPEGLRLAMERLIIRDPKSVTFIGDAFADFETAAAAKTRFVYVCRGVEPDCRIQAPVITNLRQLLRLLNLT